MPKPFLCHTGTHDYELSQYCDCKPAPKTKLLNTMATKHGLKVVDLKMNTELTSKDFKGMPTMNTEIEQYKELLATLVFPSCIDDKYRNNDDTFDKAACDADQGQCMYDRKCIELAIKKLEEADMLKRATKLLHKYKLPDLTNTDRSIMLWLRTNGHEELIDFMRYKQDVPSNYGMADRLAECAPSTHKQYCDSFQ
jgi:hypothetical protein